jgi:hypothetical protein
VCFGVRLGFGKRENLVFRKRTRMVIVSIKEEREREDKTILYV